MYLHFYLFITISGIKFSLFSGYNAATLFQNLQKRFLSYRDCDTFQTRYSLGSMVRLSVLQPDNPLMRQLLLSPTLGCAEQHCGSNPMRFRAMVFNTTFNNVSVIPWQSVLLVDEIRIPGENHWSVASNWQALSHNLVSSTPRHKQDSNSQL